MCATCGCSELSHDDQHDQRGHGHHHQHDHVHAPHSHDAHGHDSPVRHPTDGNGHRHSHARPPAHAQTLEAAILGKNDRIAATIRATLSARKIVALNFMSSPGAGKTTLLERTIRDLRSERQICVIEGDQETSRDGDRIRAAGAAAIQINTGTGCHLDAAMVESGMQRLAPIQGSLLFIENVGNLVCPALFDLGERAKIVVASVTEGEDKPLKYPHIFRASRLVLLNKVDLLPYLSFDVQRFVDYAHHVNPQLDVVLVSAIRGTGLDHWYAWLRAVDAA